MKQIVILMLCILSFRSHAIVNESVALKTCIDADVFQFVVIQKASSEVYQLAGNWMSPHAVLSTKMPIRQGRLAGRWQYIGQKSLAMANGFQTTFDVFEACK